MITSQQQLEELKRGTIDFIDEKDFIKKVEKSLKTKKPLRVKLGVDPTAPDIHLGHTVALQKLRQFQDLGHHAVLIIGDYTALVGDPSGTQKTRPQLSQDLIKKNAQTYFDQVQKILDMKKTEVRYNGEWFSKMSFVEVIKLASRMTVARMLERDDFSKRFKGGTPICIHEFIYPLMQGYDSLMVQADVELGGTDQIFNLLVGRQLQKEEGGESQVVLTIPLLEGTDGIRKMSKSYDNYIGVTEAPSQIFGKVMSISDELMWKYYNLLSRCSLQEIEEKKEKANQGTLNPKFAKMELAYELVTRFYPKIEADKAQEEFNRIFQSKQNPSDIEEVALAVTDPKILVTQLMLLSHCAATSSEAKRLIQQGAVSIGNQKISDIKALVDTNGEVILKVGKRVFKKVIFKPSS